MKDINNYSVVELEAALNKKKEEEAESNKKSILTPVEFDQTRFEAFKEVNILTLQDILDGRDKDADHYLYEASLQFVFGDDIFKKLKKVRSF